MAKTKERFTGSPDEEAQRLADRLFRAIAAHFGFEPGGEGVAVNIGTTLDALLYLAALIIETTPQLSGTPRDVREITDDMGQTVKELVRALREITERTGRHPMADFGGGEVFEKGDVQ